MKNFFDRHEKVALMFSGGRDSLACLHLMKDYLDKTVLIWVNTGAAFPEIIEMMDVIRHSVPNFLEIQTDQPKAIKERGYPSDVVPVSFSAFGQACTTSKPIKIRSYMECCEENFWKPADETARSCSSSSSGDGVCAPPAAFPYSYRLRRSSLRRRP